MAGAEDTDGWMMGMGECDAMAWGCCSSQSKRERCADELNEDMDVFLPRQPMLVVSNVFDGGRCQRGDATIRTLSADMIMRREMQ